MKTKEIIKIGVGIFIFFGVVFLYTQELNYIINTEKNLKFLGAAWLFGILFSIGLILILIRNIDELFEKFMISVATLTLVTLLIPLMASKSNRLLGDQESQMVALKLIDISSRSEQPYGLSDSTQVKTDGYRIQVLKDGQMESFYVKDKSSFQVQDETIYLRMKSGGWGFDYVEEK